MQNKIPVIILCGGFGSRLGIEGKKYPKALIKIGGKPIISHLIDFFKKQNYLNIYLATGHKHKQINNFIKKKKIFSHIKVVNTGLNTMTGGRILRLKKYLKSFNQIMVTYGDGLSNINLNKLVNYHKKKKAFGTVTAVKPFSHFGELFLSKNNNIYKFSEKEYLFNRWINGGFFVFENKIFDILRGDKEILEKKPLKILIKNKKLFAYKHKGFWKCLDNNKDKIEFNKLIKNKKKPWLE